MLRAQNWSRHFPSCSWCTEGHLENTEFKSFKFTVRKLGLWGEEKQVRPHSCIRSAIPQVSLVLVRGKEKMWTRAEAITLAVMPALIKIHSESPGPLDMVDRLHQSSNLEWKQLLHKCGYQLWRIHWISSPVLSCTHDLWKWHILV
jgi:hypothetical protein